MVSQQRKQITNPQALRALAHPIRLKLLELLTADGPATGKTLADLTGESTASVSYHVGQLAKWGLVEPALELARGRERPWQATSRGITWTATGDGSPEFAAASRALREQFIARRLAALDEFQRREDEFDVTWREAAWLGEDMGHLNPAELTEATKRIKAVIAEYTNPGRPRREGARQVAFFAYAVPTYGGPS